MKSGINRCIFFAIFPTNGEGGILRLYTIPILGLSFVDIPVLMVELLVFFWIFDGYSSCR